MPLEPSSLKLSEKVLVLTHALLAAARREDWEDFSETLRAREAAIVALGCRPLDKDSASILSKAHAAEKSIEQAIKDAQGAVIATMADAYRGRRGLANYDRGHRQGGLLDSQG